MDSLEHAYGHLRDDTESARRHALVGFDHAIEVGVVCFLNGAGAADETPEAAEARRPKSWFPKKVAYIVALARTNNVPLRVTEDDLNISHSLRNHIQHAPGWIVPEPAQVEISRKAVVDSLSLFGLDEHLERRFPSVYSPTGVRDRAAQYLDTPPHAVLPKRLSEAAWVLAREIDPEGEGVHISYLAERLAMVGFPFGRRDPKAKVYDAVRLDKRRFRFVASMVYRWMESDDRDVAPIAVSDLRDVAYAAARLLDPRRDGVRTNDLFTKLLKWHIPISGADPGATVRRAVASDRRFRRVGPATYRWE